MKYIVFSFDDGRKDFYTNALPVLKKYSLQATLNVITDFLGKKDLNDFASANHECMTIDEMIECANAGIEIACHSSNHTNRIEQIKTGVKFLTDTLGTKMEWENGFASPESEIYEGNIEKYIPLLENGTISYIRSGNQIHRDGYFHALMYLLYKYTHSKFVYRLYNKRNIIRLHKGSKSSASIKFYPSVTCNADNTMKQVTSFITSLQDDTAAIFMFHSIISDKESGWRKDRWYNDTEDFEKLCKWIKKRGDVAVLTNIKLHRMVERINEWNIY